MANRPTGPDVAAAEPAAHPAPAAAAHGVSPGDKLTTEGVLAEQGVGAFAHMARGRSPAPTPSDFDPESITLEPQTFRFDAPQRSIQILAHRSPVVIRGIIADPGCPGYDAEGKDGLYTTPSIDEAITIVRAQAQAEGTMQGMSDGTLREKAAGLIRLIKLALLRDHPLARSGMIRPAAEESALKVAQKLEEAAQLVEAQAGDATAIRAQIAALKGAAQKASANVRPAPSIRMPG